MNHSICKHAWGPLHRIPHKDIAVRVCAQCGLIALDDTIYLVITGTTVTYLETL